MSSTIMIRLFCILTFAVSGANGHLRRLQDTGDHSAYPTSAPSVLYHDDDHVGCGTVSASVEERLQVARAIKSWTSKGRHLAAVNYTVPVYMWHTHLPGKIPLSETAIKDEYFAALVDTFKDTPFQFELMDIQTIESEEYGQCARLDETEYAMKKAHRVFGKNVLNVYICDSSISDSRFWSSFPVHSDIDPLYDGVVVRNLDDVAPNKRIQSAYNLGHEVGHWLGLEHTFVGGCTPSVWYDLDGIAIVGDDVDDTPSHARPTWEYPGQEVCWVLDPPLDTCRDKKGANPSAWGVDPVHNHMNYLSGDCTKLYGEFTPGQVARMVAQYEMFRKDEVCRPMNVGCALSSQCCDDMVCQGDVSTKMACKKLD